MVVGDRMTKRPSTVFPDDTVAQAQEKLRAGGFRQLPVVENGRLLGILTDRDIRRYGRNIAAKVQSAMTSDVITVAPETPIEEAARLLLTHKIGALPVLEGNDLVGIISTSDILRAFLDLMDAKAQGR